MPVISAPITGCSLRIVNVDIVSAGIAPSRYRLSAIVAPRRRSQKSVRRGAAALISDLFERELVGARPEQTDRRSDHDHCAPDEYEHAGNAGCFQEESNKESGEDRAESTPRIDEADRPCPDAGRVN